MPLGYVRYQSAGAIAPERQVVVKYETSCMYANVKCSECGTVMRWFDPSERSVNEPLCSKCEHPVLLGCGNTASGHYGDDPSGGSSSWDIAVARYEGE